MRQFSPIFPKPHDYLVFFENYDFRHFYINTFRRKMSFRQMHVGCKKNFNVNKRRRCLMWNSNLATEMTLTDRSDKRDRSRLFDFRCRCSHYTDSSFAVVVCCKPWQKNYNYNLISLTRRKIFYYFYAKMQFGINLRSDIDIFRY